MTECENCKLLQQQIDQLNEQWRTIFKPVEYPMPAKECTCGEYDVPIPCPVHGKT